MIGTAITISRGGHRVHAISGLEIAYGFAGVLRSTAKLVKAIQAYFSQGAIRVTLTAHEKLCWLHVQFSII
jgi:hypothetical protein